MAMAKKIHFCSVSVLTGFYNDEDMSHVTRCRIMEK